ncbi:hypothetical protein [Streptomyces sp. I05A-00742]|uniref:hypothetical protein n=1 Tax=Streptomyces sp. I05A-00742 TaxID=2732853 RepID=UPI001BB2B976|nr:hypothetical protein [Streptomyces sp. I05A-00742]
MTLVLTFVGATQVPSGTVGAAYNLWTYKAEGTSQDLPQGNRLALALAGDINVLDPAAVPGVPALEGTSLQKDPSEARQYVSREIRGTGPQTIAFIAPVRAATGEVLLMKSTPGNPFVSMPFALSSGGQTSHSQRITVPAPGLPAYAGRPVADFAGQLPYASELFGVYHPLSGWLGAYTSIAASEAHPSSPFANLAFNRFFGPEARKLTYAPLAALAEHYDDAESGGLSPVGLVNLFREYFFEFDTFLGPPVGHIWVSPGGSVEVVESSTRRTLVEKAAEVSEEVSRKTEESLTEQDDVADAVKEENSRDTKLGVSATGGVNAAIYHADVSASFSTQNTVKRGSEATHKHTRTQAAKATSEIKRNFKTSFRTVTETTDTSSRRYILQNTTNELVNYELRRKLRKVGLQLQHVGSRLCWQVFIGDPGRDLGLGDMVHVVEAPDLTAIPKPEKQTYPQDQKVTHPLELKFVLTHGADTDAENTYKPDTDPNVGIFKPDVGHNDLIKFRFDFTLPPPPEGFEIKKGVPPQVDVHGAQVQFTIDAATLNMGGGNPDPATNAFALRLTYANFQGNKSLPIDVTIVYTLKAETKAAIDKANDDAENAYKKEVTRLQHEAYGKAVRERLHLVSTMRSRTPEDLRSEERRVVFRNLIRRLEEADQYPKKPDDWPYPEAEGIQHLFDVDEMLYFVAPDFWRPGPVPPPPVTNTSTGRYPLPPGDESSPTGGTVAPLQGQTVGGWYSRAEKYRAADGDTEWRVDYLITEQTRPAPLGSSLGWLIQIDADERRNEFLNAAWVKAVLPVRPGQEQAALKWLTGVEGEAGLDVNYVPQSGDPDSYQNKKVGEVLALLTTHLNAVNADYTFTQASEKVFETGFDPLAGGFRPAKPYEVFDQWVEVLPTDQVAAVAVKYDPKTGQQLP